MPQERPPSARPPTLFACLPAAAALLLAACTGGSDPASMPQQDHTASGPSQPAEATAPQPVASVDAAADGPATEPPSGAATDPAPAGAAEAVVEDEASKPPLPPPEPSMDPAVVAEKEAEIAALRQQGDYREAFLLAVEVENALQPGDIKSRISQQVEELRSLKGQVGSVRLAISDLLSGDRFLAKQATLKLITAGEAGCTFLLQALSDADPDQQQAIVDILSRYEDPRISDPIMAIYRELPAEEQRQRTWRLAAVRAWALRSPARRLATVQELSDPTQAGQRAEAELAITLLQDERQELTEDFVAEAQPLLEAFVEQANESTDQDVRQWASRHAGFADLFQPGLQVRWFANEQCEGEPYHEGISAEIDLDKEEFPERSEKVSAIWTGSLRITQAGSYRLQLTSDDGSRLSLAGEQIIDNWGYHGMEEKSAKVDLSVGRHPIEIRYMQGGGGGGIRFEWQPPGAKDYEPVGGEHIVHRP